MTRMYKTDIKFLIHLVGERPALWDKTSKLYADRSLKETSWHEICTILNENYEYMQPDAKLNFAKMVKKKWAHIRDAWVQSMKQCYNEETKLPPKPYVYHEQLKFLQKILGYRRPRYGLFERLRDGKQYLVQQREDDNNDDYKLIGVVGNTMETELNEESNKLKHQIDFADDDYWTIEDTQTSAVAMKQELDQDIRQHPQQPQILIQNPRSLADQKSHLPRSNSCYESNLNENRHWSFFNGILPSLNTLDDDHTLQFQAEVITLLQKLKVSQKQLPDSSKKKRTIRDDEDTVNEWPVHNVIISKRYSLTSEGGDE